MTCPSVLDVVVASELLAETVEASRPTNTRIICMVSEVKVWKVRSLGVGNLENFLE